MKLLCLLLLIAVSLHFVIPESSLEDNDFAEFDEFEVDGTLKDDSTFSEPTPIVESKQNVTNDSTEDESNAEATVEIEDAEFEHFADDEEFEGFGDTPRTDEKKTEPKITITNVPLPFRANWESYWLELLMIAGIVVYFINFFTGKSKNTKIANAWLATHKNMLEDNFSLIGDDGKTETEANGYIKETESQFILWCSGRTCCEGMLVELKMIKRQDLIAVMSTLVKPAFDQLHVRILMNKEDMDNFVFCLASKKTAAYFQKEMADISVYCGEKRSGDKYKLSNQFFVLSEIPEATAATLDSRTTAFINKYAHMIDYIHFSDQYSGVKQQEDSAQLKLPDTQKVLLFGFNIPIKGLPLTEAMENTKPLMAFVFYCLEKVKRYKLSKEGKAKSDKNRSKVEEAFMRSTWQARAEAAALRRDERKRAERERILAEADPERQRRWEEKEQKRQAKKRAPKMKQLKVKAL